jgi:hypothetical protein
MGIRTRTKKPFALNLWVPFEDSDRYVLGPGAF